MQRRLVRLIPLVALACAFPAACSSGPDAAAPAPTATPTAGPVGGAPGDSAGDGAGSQVPTDAPPEPAPASCTSIELVVWTSEPGPVARIDNTSTTPGLGQGVSTTYHTRWGERIDLDDVAELVAGR